MIQSQDEKNIIIELNEWNENSNFICIYYLCTLFDVLIFF